MKRLKKITGLLFMLAMMMSLCVTIAFAQNVDTKKNGPASITIKNASKGDTYKVYKLFGATVTGSEGGPIAYTGEIPEGLSAYFEKDTAGNITAKTAAAKTDGSMSDELKDALKSWTVSAVPVIADGTVSDGSILQFTNLEYGYYVVTTIQGGDTKAITVTSTNPTAEIVDKNSTAPVNLTKNVDKTNVSIGDSVTYTVKFTSSNYAGAGTEAKQINSYIINDSLPDFLKDVTVNKITIADVEYKVEDKVPQFSDHTITIPWVNGESCLYNNGAEVQITYTAVVTEEAAIAGAGNTNTVTLTWKDKDGNELGHLSTDATIYTYAAAIQKVDENRKNLSGAKFKIKGLTVTGSKGNYKVVSYDSSVNAPDGTEMEMDDDGLLAILGVTSNTTLVAIETQAPEGYNKLTGTINVQPVYTKDAVTATTKYYDEEGKEIEESGAVATSRTIVSGIPVDGIVKIENHSGSILPSTGGIGTTIFYVVGAILVLGAGILLVTRKRMDSGK